jgi:predicted acyltransferase
MTSLVTETLPAAKPRPREATPSEPVPADKPARLMSLDAYRGFIMLAMASAGFAFAQVARNLAEAERGASTPLWDFLGFQTDHVPWVGCSFWDLIQPSFMFMVGVAIPYSYASRKAKGDSERKILIHAALRALILILLAVFLSSPMHEKIDGKAVRFDTTNWIFPNVLAQIGLGYFFVFLLRGRGLLVQLGAVAAIFVGYTLFFGLWPLPAPGFDTSSVGVPPDWPELMTGWFAHWNKNTNAAAAFDGWFLNLFPRPVPFRFNEGGYQTLNFVPSMITMILGLMAGEMLRGMRKPWTKLGILVVSGAVCLGLGLLAGEYVCPIVKRIWTPSWALYSAGWTFFLLASFYAAIDLLGFRGWAWPFVVVGMNSIAIYCMAQLLKGWIAGRWQMHLGSWWFADPIYGPAYKAAAVLLVLWLVCVWMYRQKIFVRI